MDVDKKELELKLTQKLTTSQKREISEKDEEIRQLRLQMQNYEKKYEKECQSMKEKIEQMKEQSKRKE